MLLIDAVEDWNADQIACWGVDAMDRAHPLRRSEGLPASAAVEYAAQAMALHAALLGQYLHQRLDASDSSNAQPRGMLVVISNVIWTTPWMVRGSGENGVAPLRPRIRARRISVLEAGAQYEFNVELTGFGAHGALTLAVRATAD